MVATPATLVGPECEPAVSARFYGEAHGDDITRIIRPINRGHAVFDFFSGCGRVAYLRLNGKHDRGIHVPVRRDEISRVLVTSSDQSTQKMGSIVVLTGHVTCAPVLGPGLGPATQHGVVDGGTHPGGPIPRAQRPVLHPPAPSDILLVAGREAKRVAKEMRVVDVRMGLGAGSNPSGSRLR